MDAFVEHVDRVEQLQMIAAIAFEISKLLARGRILGIRGVNMRFRVDFSKPIFYLALHFPQVLYIGTEHYIFAGSVGHMLVKNRIQTVCHFQCMAKRFQILLRSVFSGFCFGAADEMFKLFVILLIGKYGKDILRRIQDSSDDCLTERHFGRDIAIKQLVRHIPLIIEISYRRCG